MSESVAPSHRIALNALPGEVASSRSARVSDAARLFLPTTFITLWIGFTLIPGVSPIPRASFAIALAAFAGFGAVMTARRAADDTKLPGQPSAAWALPSAVVLLLVYGLTPTSVAGPAAAPLAALGAVAMMALQLCELETSSPLAALATGLARLFASVMALVGCAVVMTLPLSWLPVTASLIGLLATPAIVRESSSSIKRAVVIGLLGGLAAGEVAWVMLDASLPVWAMSGGLAVTLFAIAGTCDAAQGDTPRRSYAHLVAAAAITMGAFALAALRP